MATSAPRACIIRQSYRFDAHVLREVEALISQGYVVDVVMAAGALPDDPIAGLTMVNLPLRRHRGGSTLRYVFDYVSFAALATVVVAWRHLRRRYALVQVTSMPDFLAVAGVIPKLFGAKLVVFLKEPVPELFETRSGSPSLRRTLVAAEQLAVRVSDRAITVTDELRATMVGRGARADKMSVVLNSVPLPAAMAVRAARLAPHSPGSFMVVTHGLLETRYGVDVIVRACIEAHRTIPGLRLWIMGEGPAEGEIRSLVEREDAGGVVSVLGFVSSQELSQRLSQADVGVIAQLPSPYANLVHTTKMYEYFALGMPVIASDLVATRRAFPPPSVRYVPGGDVAALAAALIEMARCPDIYARFGSGARAAHEVAGWESTQRHRYNEAIAR